MNKKTLSLLFLLLLFSAALAAGENTAKAAGGGGDSQWTLESLMLALSEVKHREDTYVETKWVNLLSQPIKLTGTLVFTAPDYLEKRVAGPEPGAYIVRGSDLRIQMFEQKERELVLFQYPAIQALVESIRATLAGDLKTLKEFYTVVFSTNGGGWQLRLEPALEDMQGIIREVIISGRGTRLLEIETIEVDDDRSVITINSDKKNGHQ